MTLATHGVAGAAIGAAIVGNVRDDYLLLTTFTLAFISHWLLDAIPHYDYRLSSLQHDHANHLNDDMVIGVKFVRDLIFIGGDILLGLVISWFLFGGGGKLLSLHPAVLIGYSAAILPDFLQFVQMKLRIEPFKTLKRMHDFFHSDIQIHSGFWFANTIQLVPLIIFILLANYLF